jgi:hypothetical protein
VRKYFLCVVLLSGCYGDQNAKLKDGSADHWSWSIVTFDGHDYVRATASGHGNVIHSPNCPCFKKQ